MEDIHAITYLVDQLQVGSQDFHKKSKQEQFDMLSKYLNNLIATDFNKLLSILYRIDVAEETVRHALENNTRDILSGQIIAELLLKREKEKIKLRAKYSKRSL